MTWALVEHTADLAIEADGPDAGSVLADAGTALAAVVTDREDMHEMASDEELDLRVEAPDLPSLAVAWLSELLWCMESKDLLWTTGGVTVEGADAGGFVAHGIGNAVRYDPVKHGQGTEVKAITYHDLRYGPVGPRWHLRVLLDL